MEEVYCLSSKVKRPVWLRDFAPIIRLSVFEADTGHIDTSSFGKVAELLRSVQGGVCGLQSH